MLSAGCTRESGCGDLFGLGGLSAPMPTLVGLGGPISDRVTLPGTPQPMPTPSGGGMDTGATIAAFVIGGVILAATIGLGALYNSWAYGDWTCIVKNCVQSSTKR